MYYEINKTTKEHRIVKPQPMGQRGYIAPPPPGWRRVEADEDGWIRHYGGGCPLPDGVRFDAVMLDGEVALGEPPCPDSAWYHQWGSADIVKYRPIPSDRAETESPEWDGEGLPSAGVKCEAVCSDGEWGKVTVVHADVDNGHAVFACPHSVGLKYYWQPARRFRPIRTDEEAEVEEMLKIVRNGDPFLSTMEVCLTRLYRAGYRRHED